ncbi:MAG TPA: Xaa-Pro peptidase family protein [Candidatus Bathyarchaeia archaeon]|nr:Xaa-Pro peptidase family protein [Candidatus Bathyarchaeia archaeon]
MNRIAALKQQAFEEKNFDGFLIANSINLFYLSGVQGASCLLIPKKGENTIYVYGVNYEQAKADGKGFRVEMVKRGENLMEKIASQTSTLKIKKLAVDALSVESYRSLAKGLRGKAKMKMQNNLVWELRKVKDEHETELMRKAGELTSIGMKIAYETIKPGISEIEVAAEIEYAMRRKGSWGTAFETSVASGVRSAFPHGGCTERKMQTDDLVVIDIGATYQHYCSDMTRTVVAGKPTEKQKKLYEIVKTAQEKAHQTITPKAKAKDVDTAARNEIEKAGYGEYFVHGLGHGVGLEIHEPPTLSQASKEKLAVGNVVTNEPGIYLIGFGGIRIEDSVLVQKRNAEKLTNGPCTLETEK